MLTKSAHLEPKQTKLPHSYLACLAEMSITDSLHCSMAFYLGRPIGIANAGFAALLNTYF